MKTATLMVLLVVTLAVMPWAQGSQPAPTLAGDNGLRLHFQNASLEIVLNYLSDAAGFIVDVKADLKGRISVFSYQPVTPEEALRLITTALNENGYTAIRDGRTLSIWDKESAKKRDLPVKSGNRTKNIPKSDEMVTQIIPIRYINAVQISRSPQSLLPDKATITVNESGNCIILTDTQTTIRRMVEIVQALDTAIASVSNVRVFTLKFADAKSVASVIKDLFTPQDSTRNDSQGQGQTTAVTTRQLAGDGASDFASGGRGQSARNSGGDGGGSETFASRLVAVAEERSNSVVVRASDAEMKVVEGLVKRVDVNVQDVTELRMFRLTNADAQETADLISNLFGDLGSGLTQNSGQFQFGGGGTTGANLNAVGDSSAWMQEQSRVVAIPDLRSGSLMISAAKGLMVQISKIIGDLDEDASRKQRVFVYSVQHSDAASVQGLLEGLFPASMSGGSNSRSTSQQNSAGNQLSARATQNQNQATSRSSSSPSGGSGSSLGSSTLGNR